MGAAVLAALLSWRLSYGPLELPWLAARLQAAINADSPTRLSLGGAALAWEGFRAGVDRPLDIRVTDVSATDSAGKTIASVPRAEMSLSVGWLLLGRIVPRAIEVDGARLRVIRSVDGDLRLDLGSLAEAMETSPEAPDLASPDNSGLATNLLRELTRPAAADHAAGRTSRWSQLRRVRIHDAAISVIDRQLHATWRVRGLSIDLERRRAGGVTGSGEATLALGDQSATLSVTAALGGSSGRTSISASLTQVVPAPIATLIPEAAAFAAVDAPLTLSGSAELDAELQPVHMAARAVLGAGVVHVRAATIPLTGATLEVEGTPSSMQLHLSRLDLVPRPDGPTTHVTAAADVTRDAEGAVRANAALDLDALAFADLPALWPEGTGGVGARPWITRNITDGMLRRGHVELSLTAPADLSDAEVTRLVGGVDGDGATIHWLRPVPPIEQAAAHLSLNGTDGLEISLTGGRQAGGTQGGVRIRGGRVVFTGFNNKDQFADIDGELAGPVADLLALLRNPRIRLLDRTPLNLRDATGQIAGRLTVTKLPLRDRITMDDVQIRAATKISDLHLTGIAAGHDLDRGELTLDVDPDGLHAAGNAVVAVIPAQLQFDMDFRGGQPAQVLQRMTASGSLDARQLAGLGLDPQPFLSGPSSVTATLALHRDGHGEAVIGADLGRAVLTLDRLGFRKPAGEPAKLDATVRLDGEQVTGVDGVRLVGTDLHVEGAVDFAGGRPDGLRLTQAVIGKATDVRAEIRLPHRAGDAWQVKVGGASLDATTEFARHPAQAERTPAREPPPGPPWLLDATIDRVVLGKGQTIGTVAAHVEDDGRLMRRVQLSGRTAGAPFQLTIEPHDGGRRLSASTSDAGGLLRALDVLETMQGGKMSLTGTYDDNRPDHPLSGTAQIDDFRIRNAPMLAKLLQGMTLYGLTELVRGPGLGFSQLVAPFRLASDTLELTDARAFNASLGMTVKGRIDLAQRVADLQGTIVPAYFFNTLLGDIPLVGRLFSPERGGGLFAASYTVKGGLDDPAVSINPLSALTPGFLRGVFGVFSGSGQAAAVRPVH